MLTRRQTAWAITTAVVLAFPSLSAADKLYEREDHVVYGYKDGMALIMSVFVPDEPNGAGVILLQSGGFRSHPKWLPTFDHLLRTQWLLEEGYVVFAVAHSSGPRYRPHDIYPDISRAVRFVRHNAVRFQISPQRIGMTGFSSGAALTLMAALNPTRIDSEAADPVDRVSSRLQAVVATRGQPIS